MSRTFTVEAAHRGTTNLRVSGGRYISNSPSGAASKAFSQILRNINIKGKVTITIHIRETTQGSKHKTYGYKVSRVPNNTSADWIKSDDQSISFAYTTKVKSLQH